ncbi:hypothetical protein OM076_40400 [Solirubrobacter ginsenosidimutans]|uniref:Uncharacterized protein n=1 Tax=Solirubrobacter ginsenosidimutans TaxID=490573 RepID=A0A9X3N183_9ACTN|nr:hypothetical protein [Solirubrobacter ginsenosidimutans]MDA0166594.1 hypothetical protein [Solirubrobacter ginsenosidimutans]
MAAVLISYRVGLPTKFESRSHTVGLATATALIDTPSSQVVDLGGETGNDPSSLASRASLLASLMTTSPLREEIAKQAGISPTTLIASSIDPAGGAAAAAAAPAVSGAVVTAKDPRANILKVSIPNIQSSQVPIIVVNTQAPDAAGAAKLANEAIVVLKAHVTALAASQQVPGARRIVVTQLGPAQAESARRGPSPLISAIIFVFVFLIGCAVILTVLWLRGAWETAAEDEQMPAELAEVEWLPVNNGEPAPIQEAPARKGRASEVRRRTSSATRGGDGARDWMSAP